MCLKTSHILGNAWASGEGLGRRHSLWSHFGGLPDGDVHSARNSAG